MDALQQFLVDGFVDVMPSNMSPADHDGLYGDADSVYAEAATSKSKTLHLDLLGDQALRDRVPNIAKVLSDPAVTQTLEALLGPGYFVHPHMFLHKATTGDQPFHQDGNLPWNERGHYRPHRCDWALLFYYPQAVTLENGPTEIVPGSQYWTKDIEREDGSWHPGDALDRRYREDGVVDAPDLSYRDQRNTQALASLGVPDLECKFVTVPQGSVVICNYDIIHRGSRQASNQPARYMYKFYFARTDRPEAQVNMEHDPVPAKTRPTLRPVVQHCLDWQLGSKSTAQSVDYSLTSEREDERVAAAYQLAANDEVEPLIDGLHHPRESVRRAAAYGLRAIDPSHTDAIAAQAQSTNVSTRRLALFALGNVENAQNQNVVETLIKAIRSEPDDLARSNAAYALGQVGRGDLLDPEAVFSALLHRLTGSEEPDNTEVALLPRSTVRQSLAYAALQIASNHQLDQASTSSQIELLSADRDRYVKGFMQEVQMRLTR